jgi:hypothetical protein
MLEHIAIDLPQEDARFLATFAREKGISVSDAIGQLVAFLHRTHLRQPNQDIMSLIGVLKEPPSMWDYLSTKYQ